MNTCDFCTGRAIGIENPNNQTPAIIDGPTHFGPFGNMCARHLVSAGYPDSKMNTWFNCKDPVQLAKDQEEVRSWLKK